MPKGIYPRTKRGKYKITKKRIEKRIEEKIKRPNKFRRSIEELREFCRENDIKLLGIWEYIRRRNYKKSQKETIIKCQK